VVLTGLPPCAEVEVVRHEVGHLLGLGHTADPNSTMYGGHDRERWPECVRQEAAADLATYEVWLAKEVRRCRHRRVRRAICFAGVRSIRGEVIARRETVAALPPIEP
jgi:hypothetical protein